MQKPGHMVLKAVNWVHKWFILDPIDSLQDHLPSFITVYQNDSFQDHLTWFLYIYIYYLYIHNLHMHAPHAHICTTQKMFVYMHNNKYMCHIHYQKHIWGFMHHIHIHAPPRTYVRIHAPHTHTCTTYTYIHHQIPPENKICLVDLTSVLYERPNQNERFLLNNMFLVHFSEMHSAFQWNAQYMKCTGHFSEMRWNAQGIPVKCTEMRSTFQWNALKRQCISPKCPNSLECIALFTEMRSVFWWAFGFPPSIGLSYERPIRSNGLERSQLGTKW